MRRARRSASVVPRKRRRSNLKDNANRRNESMVESALDLVSRNGTRWTPFRSVFNCRWFEFLFFLKPLGVSPFCSSHFKPSGEGSVQPRSRRPGRTGSARGTHTRTFTCTLGRICQAHASFFVPTILGSREGLRAATMHTPIIVHEVPVNALCSRRVMILVLCGRAAVCLRLPSLA